ncbi:MAG TPA: allantoicase [Pseudonocardiaceae bacterium]|jgi:allantoicase|nr:allantoicase [Pseudonocardiaceae bacterium]
MTETDDAGIEALVQLPDLASRRLGAGVLAANDEFFAERENLIKPEEPVFRPLTFTNKGQEYDGWETRRRRRESGDADWVIVRLGAPGIPRAIVIDTAFFKGNYPPFASVEGAGFEGYPDIDELTNGDWETIVDHAPLRGDTKNVFTVDGSTRYTHIRLKIFPDGGVARLRVHGEVVPDPRWLADVPLDLAALASGGSVVECSNWFFSLPNNMLQPGESRFMADGWETARRRDDGHDWAVISLAAPTIPRVVEIDTTHYKGNAPDRVSLRGRPEDLVEQAEQPAGQPAETASQGWVPILTEARLQPDTTHRFRVAIDRPISQLRLDIFPDGGIGRLRVYGRLTGEAGRGLAVRWFASLPVGQAIRVLTGDCGLDELTAKQHAGNRGPGVGLPEPLVGFLGLAAD